MTNTYEKNPTLEKHYLISRVAAGEEIEGLGKKVLEIDNRAKPSTERKLDALGNVIGYFIR